MQVNVSEMLPRGGARATGESQTAEEEQGAKSKKGQRQKRPKTDFAWITATPRHISDTVQDVLDYTTAPLGQTGT